MISTLHTAAMVDDLSRCTGVTKKEPKCIADYNTHMHGVDTADQYLAYYPFIRKTVKWPKKVFFYLLQCALFNSYVVFTKSNPHSHKSFLDYLVDVSENLIHTREDVSKPSSSDKSQDSSRTPTPTPPQQAPKSDPHGRLDGELKNHKLVHIPPPKKGDTYTKMSSVYTEKYQERNEICLHALQCSSPSRRLLHTISYTEILLKVCSKFQIFISYSFLVIDFFIRRHTSCLTTH
jgi:hypothetical protein